ncbi:hypothetical protein bcgnr5378_62510 [Bacillus cereus]|uniref:Uncharacterized protein n=3 Tax=Bacillus cereus group TaxID=86661 RepID=A0A150AYQ1_BACCE|nr:MULTISPECIES: hypothetical protein [Bacillus]KXX90087.1 hypothetical protein AT274_01640 [Bacillus cereus]RSC66219.1 hypothetical protein EGS86_01790 [Bacillus sp. (in: firmicutes)]TSI08758.1 hypothetical protein FOT98_25035 [Bacillus sp. HY001]BCC62465.1 hypothetical protein BCJMU10_p332 [Bacillus cereus]BCD32927.1 hypothetical protein BC30102_p419 [Bacillus cereus]
MKELLRFTKENKGEINEIAVLIRKDFTLFVEFKGHRIMSYIDGKGRLRFYDTTRPKEIKFAGIGISEEQLEVIQNYIKEEEIRLEQEKEQRIVDEFGEITDESEIRFTYTTGYDFNVSKLPKAIRDLIMQLEKKDVKGYEKVDFYGDYSVDYVVTMTYKQLLTLVENRKKENEIIETKKQERIEKDKKEFEEKKKQARETGKRVKLSHWMEPCNDPTEECSIDFITKYIAPDGKIEIVRSHSY